MSVQEEETSSVPSSVIVHRYLHKCQSVAQPPGLADFLKGTIYLYQQSKRGLGLGLGLGPKAYDLVVDFSHHPMGTFVVPSSTFPKTEMYQEITTRLTNRTDVHVEECFNQHRPVIRAIVQQLQQPQTQPQTQTTIYAVCHEPYDQFDSHELTVLSPDDQDFMKSVLTFHPELVETADTLQTELGLDHHNQEFAVLHLRMGDQQSAQENANSDQLAHVEEYLQRVILPQWGNRILVLSDSYYTKKYLSTKYNLKCTHVTPVHMGEAAAFLHRGEIAPPTAIGHTLTEFILLSRSHTIYVHSVYGWSSGFSKVCAHIYGIPYILIPNK
jgi:hypothetical protein